MLTYYIDNIQSKTSKLLPIKIALSFFLICYTIYYHKTTMTGPRDI